MGNYISEQPWISEGMVDFTVARKRNRGHMSIRDGSNKIGTMTTL